MARWPDGDWGSLLDRQLPRSAWWSVAVAACCLWVAVVAALGGPTTTDGSQLVALSTTGYTGTNSITPPGYSLLAKPVEAAAAGVLAADLGFPGWRLGRLLIVVLVFAVPATTSAMVKYFHPQDALATAAILLAAAMPTRGRPAAASAFLGLAFLSKQWALLAAIPLLARGGPLVAAVGLTALLFLRGARHLLGLELLAAVATCLASRLLFEPVLFLYYLLPASVLLVVIDVAHRRPPVSSSAAWVLLTTELSFAPGFGRITALIEADALFALEAAAVVPCVWMAFQKTREQAVAR
jgi:hypothetical protein